MDYDFAAMRRDGYSDAQILDALDRAGQLSFDLKAVRADEYSDSAILQSLMAGQRAAPAAEPESSSILRRAGDLAGRNAHPAHGLLEARQVASDLDLQFREFIRQGLTSSRSGCGLPVPCARG